MSDYGTVYNYVIYSLDSKYYEPMIGGLRKYDNIRIFKNGLSGKYRILQALHRIHWSSKLNDIVNLPFKRIWFRLMYEGNFSNDRPTCFIFLGGKYLVKDYGYEKYIRQRNNQNKIVVCFWDLISKHRFENFKSIKEKADLITTHDKDEAKKYNIEYLEEMMYSKIIESNQHPEHLWDVYFLGYDKGRLHKLIEIFMHLSDNGIRCEFDIVGVKAHERKKINGINYIGMMSYREYLTKLQKSRCVLEVLQQGTAGKTLRALEALAYKMKLITNCKDLAAKPYFNKNQICLFDKVTDIDINFIRSTTDENLNYSNIDLSNENRLLFIETKLQEKTKHESKS